MRACGYGNPAPVTPSQEPHTSVTPVMLGRKYWPSNGMPQPVEPLADVFQSYQLSSNLAPYSAPNGVGALVVDFLTDGYLSGVGYPPSQVDNPNRDWQLQQFQMPIEQQGLKRQMLSELQSMSSHRLPM
ncbi:hypothetical protein ARSEF4850_004315 [Beauveria asiatica]